MKLFIKQTINSIFSSNTYSLYSEDSDCIWLVDAGDVDEIIRWANSVGKRIIGVFVTHAHFDHIYGLNKLFEYNNNLKVYVGIDDKDALYSAKMNMSRYHEEGIFEFIGNNVISLSDGDVIELYDNIFVEVFSMPGHTPGSIVYKIQDFLFTGDAYIIGHDVVTLLPRANRSLAKDSWKRINDILHQKFFTLCAGHGDLFILNR